MALKNTLEKAKKEKIDAAITTEYQQLLTALQRSEETLIDKNQKDADLMKDSMNKIVELKLVKLRA